MAWDSDKATGDELTSDEWDAHVADQKGHASRHVTGGSDELTLDDLALPAGAFIDEDGGDFVVKDSNGNIVLRYDEATSSWVLSSLSTDKLNVAATGPDDVTGSRSIGTIYTAPSDQIRFVSIQMVNSGAGNAAFIRFDVEDDGGTLRSGVAKQSMVAHDSTNVVASIQYLVPAGRDYKLATQSLGSIDTWYEMDL